MNKIFKVIWSKSKQCYIVVSEIAKNKTGKKKIVVAGIFAALAMIGGIQSVEAANTNGSGSSNAVAWGTGSKAPGDNAIAIGKGANAANNNTIAIGTTAKANLDMAVAVGNEASADTHGTSIGANAKTTGYGAFAGGVNAQANGVGAIAIGGATSDAYNQNAVANGESAIALGSSAIVDGRGGVAVGWNAESKVNAVGIGFNAKAKANNTVAIGVEANNDKANAISNNYSSVSIGVATRARAVGSMAMGVSADASGKYSIALGSGNVSGDYTATANYPKATGEKAIAIGYNSNSSNTGATAIGAGATASGTDSFAGGSGTAGGNSSIAIGKSSGATNDRALAVGVNAKATGKDSVAVGSGAGGTVGLGFASRIDENTGVVQTIRNINVATTADGDNAVAVGHYANAMNSGVALGQNTLAATGGVAIGKGVFEDTNNVKAGGTVIGQDSTVTGLYSLAVGRYTFASGSTSMAMGYDASAKGNYAVAMGRKVIADGTSTAIGHHAVATNGGLAIGSQDNDASKDKTTASASGAVAIGKNTQSTLKGAVALGSDSTTATSATKQESVTINGITYNFSGATSDTGMQVSVGAAGKERQIKNVAAGEVSATSTDAINGSQLFAVASQIKPINYISVKSSAVGNKNNAGATGADAVAIGPGAQSSGDNGVSLGNGSQANAESVVSIGYQSNYGAQNNSKSIGIGWAAGYQSNGSENIGIGRDAGRKLTGSNNVSIGKSAGSGDVYTSGSVLLGQSATIINSTSATPINDVVAIGNGARGGAASSVAIGTGAIAKVKDSVAIGSGSKATVDKGAKGYDPNENRTNKYGGLTNNILTSTNAAVSVGDGASVTRQITGVAAGTNNTDAVNVAQLKSVNLAFSGNNTDTTGDVNLANGTLAIKGDTTYITTTANTNGITIAGKTQDISVNANGVASANKGMADAKNVAQSINDAISKSAYTWTVSANGDAGESVAKGNKVDFNGDSSNITVERAGKKITTKLNKDITVDSVNANNKVSVGTTTKQLVLDGTKGAITAGTGTNAIKLDGTSATIMAGSGSNAISLNGTNAQAAFGSGTNAVSINGTTGTVAGKAFTAGSTTINTTGLTSGTGSRTVLFGTNGISAGDQVINNVATGGSKDSNAANIGDVKRYVSGATLNLTDGANNKGSVQLGDQSLKVTTGTGLNATVSGQTVNIGLTTDAQNAISNGIGLLGNVGSTGIKKLKEGNVAFDIKGDGSVVKTTASNSGVTIAVDTDKLAANTNLAYTANGASTAKNVALSKGLNFVNGSNTIAIVNDDGKVSFDLNAATKNQINTNTTGVAANKASIATNASDIATNKNKIATNTTDIAANKSKIATNTTNIAANTTALARNISLGADSGAKSSQSLSTTDVAFNVKGATGDFISTKMNGNTVEVSTKRSTINSDTNSGAASVTGADGLVTAKNVADAINKAADAAKAGAAWNLTTNSSTTDKTTVKGGDTVNLVNGDNIVITQDGTDKKKITIATKKNLMVDSVTAGNTVINTSGLTNGTTVITGTGVTTDKVTVGGLSIDKTAGINAGGKVISNVASGNVNNNATDDTNAATIGDVKTAVNGLSQNLNISDGTKDSSVALKSQKLTVTGTGAAKATVNNQTITVDVAEGTLTPNTTNGTVTGTTGVAKATEVAAAINNTNTVLGNKIAKNTQDIATNTSNITANKNQITTNTTNIATNTANIAHTIALADDKGASTTAKSLKDGNVSFNIKGDNKFISTTASGNDVTLTVNEQAIKDAAKSASSFKVKANAHAEEEVKGGDTITFNNGDNIEISQAGKTFTIKTAKDMTVDSLTAGNTVINTTGLTSGTGAGAVSFGTNGISAGSQVISNVASGTVNNNATDDSNAANIGDVKQAVANLSQNLNITDGTNNGTVNLKNQKLNVAGANGVTATVNNQTITVGLDADTVNATTKGIGLTGDTGSTGNKYLKDGDVSFAVTGDGNLVSTSATTAGVKVAVDAAKVKDLAVDAVTVSKDTQADNPITVTPTSGTNSKDYAIGIDTTKLAAKTDLTYRANSAADADAKKVSLSKGLNFVDGGSTVATVDNDGKVSFDLNTATKNQINTNTADIATNKGKIATNTTNIAANTTALARNISLGADTGTASSQSLSTADVAFNVKGATGDFVSTNMNGNTVEISTTRATINSNATTGEASVTGNDGLATAQNVADAINKAADAAKAGAAWNITTNSSTTDKTAVKGGDTVDLVNGDNIEITQDGTDKKKITVATKKDITVDSVTANNKVTVGSGANKITLDGTDGSVTGKAFTGTTFTGTSFTGTSFTAGNTVINTNGLTNGTTAITGTGVTTDNVTVGGISIDKTAGINAGNKVISNVASGGTTLTNAANIGDVQNAVANLSQNLNITDGTNNGTVDLKHQKLNVAGANGVTATVNNQTITVGLDADTVNATTKGIGLTADAGSTGNKYLKDGDVSFAVTGDGRLVSTSATTAGVKVAVNSATITTGADGTITGPTTDGVATAKNVADAINAAKKASKTEITANTGEAANATTGNVTLTSTTAADGHTIYDVKLNDKVTLGSGANAVTIDGTAGKATIGSSVINGVNNTFTTGGVKAVTLDGATGTITGTTANIGGVTVDGTNNHVMGLANKDWTPGVTQAVSGRAATEDQLQKVSDAVGAGWKVNTGKVTGSTGESNGATSTKVASGEEVQFQAGNNLIVDQNGKTVAYSLNKALKDLESATFNGTGTNTTVITGDSITQTAGTQTNTSTAGGNTVADGTKSTETTAAGQVIKDGTKTNTSTVDENTIVDGAKSNKSTVDGNTITDGTNTSRITAGKAQIGTVGIDGVASKITTGGTNAVVVNGADGTVKTGNVTVTGGTTNDITGLSNTTLSATDFATKGRAATEEQLKAATGATTLKFTGDVATNTGSVNLKDDTFGIKGDGKYISTDVNGKNVNLTVSEAEVKKSAVAAVTVSTDTTDANNPLTVTPTTSADGTIKDYKVTIDGTKIANKTNLSYKANDGTAKQVSLADGLNFKNGTLTTASIDDAGVVKYDVNTASITAGTDGTITGPTTDGVATAKNVADAINAAKKASKTEITANTGEAANATTGNVTLTSTTAADGHTIYDVKLNDKVTLGSGANAVTIDGTMGAITGKTATIGGVTVNGTTNTIGGLSNTTWNGTATTGRAATEDQLKAVADAAGSQTWNITADKAGTTGNQTGTKKNATVGKDETVELVAGDNLTINQNERKFTYSLNKDLANLTSVSVGTGTTETIKLDGATGKITAKNASIGGVTIDGDNNHVTGLSNTTWNGTATTGRAATEDQLKSVADTAKTTTDAVNLKFSGDTNTSPGVVNLKDDTLGIIGDGKYVSTDANGKNLTVKVSEAEVKKSAVAAVTVSTDTTDTNNPLTVTPTTSADGTTKDYKVTIDGTKIANKTNLSYKANDGTAKQVSLADGLNFKNGTLTIASIDDNGVVKYDVNTASITAGADGTITGPTTDGVATAQNVADAINAAKKASKTEITANTGEAANATTGNVTLTSTTAADGHTIYDVKLNDKVTLGNGANAVTIDGTAGKATIGTSIVDGVNNSFTTGGVSPVTLNGATGTITGKTANIGGVTVNGTANTIGGLSNTTWNGTATTGQAATEDQLKAVADAAGSQTWEITADKKAGTSGAQTGTKENAKVGKDDKVSLIAGENLTVDQAGKNLTYSLNKDLVKMNSATFEATGGKTTVIKGDSIVQTDGANVNTSNATSNTITDGTNTSTINAGKATIGSSIIDGVNKTFTTGGNNAVTMDGAAGTIKTGAVTVTGGTTNDITGLSNTTVTGADFATKGRAATEEQLKAVGEQTWQITADKKAGTSGAQTGLKENAKVGKDDKVSLIAGENLTVDQAGKNFTYSLNTDLVKMNSATFLGTGTNTTVITGDSITQTAGTQTNISTAGGNTVADGTKSTETTVDGQVIKDGAKSNKSTVDNNVIDDGNGNVNTSNATSNTITDGTNTTATTSSSVTVKDNAGNSTVITKDNITTGVGGNKITLDGTAGKATIGSSIVDGVNNTFTTGGASPVTLNGATGTITGKTANIGGVTVDGTNNYVMGLANKDWTPGVTQAVSGRAATEDQLQKVSDAVGAGWKVNTGKVTGSTGESNGAASTKVSSGEEVQFQAGNNLIVDQNGKTVAYSLNKALKDLESATFNGTGTNTTVITGDSITQTAGTRTNTATAAGQVIKDGTKTNTSTVDENTIVDGTKSNKSTVDGNTITDGTNTTATTSNSVTVKDNAGNSTIITKDNVTTGVGANKITLDGTAGKATIGSSIVDGVNNTFTTGGVNAVKLDGAAGTIKTGAVTVTGGTTNDITGLSNTTVNSADFATKGRAATEEQLKAVGEQTWQITADKDATTSGVRTGIKKDAKVGKDNKVQLIAGENMTINQNERDFTFTLNKDLVKMNSATFLGTGSNTTVITGNSITQTAGTQTNTSTAGGNTVVDGTKSTETTAAGQVIKDGAKSNKSTVDSNVIDDGNGNKNISNATSNTITDGTNTSTITAGKANIGNIAVDGVNNKITMGNGATPVTLDGANGHLDGLTNTTWVPGVTKATTGRAATEDQLQQVSDAVGAGWKVNTGTVAGSSGISTGAASTKVSSGEEVKLQAGDNLVIDQNGKTVSYSLNKDLTKMNSATFEATDGKTTVVKGDSIVQTDGGKTNTSNAAGNTVVDGNKSTATTAAGTTITDGAKTNTSTADKNVIDDGAGNKSTFTKDGVTITKTGKDTVSLTSNGLDNGNNKIVNVAAGVANTDAVNVGQLKEYAAKSTTELTANNGEAAGSTTGNIVLTKTTAADGHTIYNNKLNDKITLGTDPTKAVTVDGTTGTVTGLTNKTWTPGSIVSGRAATEDQLKDAVADSGWKAAVDKEGSGQSNVVGTSPEKIKAEETVTFKAGNNMMVTQTGKSISYAVNPELTNMTSATFKDAAGNTTVTNSNGITITPGSANPTNPHAGPVSLTKDGLNNGNNQIKGVAPGTDPTDAVNVAQLNASNTNTSQAINQIAGEVQHVGAHAAAMAALKPIQYDPLEPTQVMAGVGNYRGETAAALGLAHYTNENTMFNVGVSVGGNHNMVNAGVTHKFGYSPEKKNIPDRYKAGPISSVYVMQDEVSSLKKENAEQKYVIADQAARLTTLEAENEQQRRELAETKKGLDDLKAAVDKLLASKG
ncbi:YadA-like family protein [Veillonella sp. 27098_8_77]|uniref:YadA-like family protein n=1 Tax=Veillonella sp. 27098_8_77 TaxID=3003642 RepID=UPI00352F704E